MSADVDDDLLERCAELTYGLLVEAGRRDLADIVAFFPDDDGTPYLEPMEWELPEVDLALMVKAEKLALVAAGVVPGSDT